MNEDDTFLALRQTHPKRMKEIVKEWFCSSSDQRKLEIICRNENWTVEEFARTFPERYNEIDEHYL